MTSARNQYDYATIDSPGNKKHIDTSFSSAVVYGTETSQRQTDSLIFLYRNHPHEDTKTKKQPASLSASVLLNMSRLYINRGDYNTGLQILNQALEVIKSNNIPVLAPYVYNNLGNIHFLLGQYTLAVNRYLQSAASALRSSTEIKDHISTNITRVFDFFSRHTKGYNYLVLAEKSPLLKTDDPLRGNIMISKSLLYLEKGEVGRAEKELNKAFKWGKTCNDPVTIRKAAHMLTSLYTKSRQYPKAAVYLKLLSEDTTSLPLSERVEILLSAGKLHIASRQYTRAGDILEQVVNTAEAPEVFSEKLEAHHILSQLYAGTGRYKEANHHSRIHTQGIQKIKNREITDNRNRIEAKYKIIQKDKQIYQNQLRINQQQIAIDKKNEWILIFSSSILILAITGFGVYRNNRHKQVIDQMKAYMAGEEKERNRIARDLHDGIGGMLASLNMHISALPSHHQSLQAAPDFSETVELLHETVREIRVTAHSLMPETLSHYGFENAMRIFCRETGQRTGVQITFHCLKYDEETTVDNQLLLYRILQELVQDTIKHAQPAQILIHVNFYINTIDVLVEDDGAGTHITSPRNRIAYDDIRQRCKALNGSITIESATGKGTSIYLQFNNHKKKN